MKKNKLKILMWIIIFIFFSVNTFGAYPYYLENISKLIKTGNETFDNFPAGVNNSGNWSTYGSSSACNVNNGKLNCTGGTAGYINQLIDISTNSINYTIFDGIVSFGQCNSSSSNFISATKDNFTDGSTLSFDIRFLSGGVKIKNEQAGGQGDSIGVINDYTEHRMKIVINETPTVNMFAFVYINNSLVSNTSLTLGYEPRFISFGNPYNGHTSCNISAREWVSYNASNYNASDDQIRPTISGIFNITTFPFIKIGDVLNITANISDNFVIINENITYNMSNQLTKINFSSSGASIQINNVTTIIGNLNDVINFTIYATDYFNNVAQFSILATIIINSNTINFSIYDENTNILLTQNVSLQIIGNTNINSTNLTITNGLGSFDQLSIDDYRIRYSSFNYPVRDYYFSLVNNTNTSIKLYLLSSGNSTNILFTLSDENGRNVENATLKALRYFLPTGYDLAVMGRTDKNGQVVLNMEFNNAFYQFLMEKNGIIIGQTTQARVIATSIPLKVTLSSNIFDSIKAKEKIYHNLSFQNSTQTFRFTYNDGTGIAKQTCLLVNEYRVNRAKYTVCYNCATSSATTLICDVSSIIANNGTLTAQGIIFNRANDNSTALIVDYIEQVNEQVVQSVVGIFGTLGLFLAFIFIGGLGTLAAASPVPLILFTLMGILFSAAFQLFSVTTQVILYLLIGAAGYVVWKVGR